jgi:hypothetical protein
MLENIRKKNKNEDNSSIYQSYKSTGCVIFLKLIFLVKENIVIKL